VGELLVVETEQVEDGCVEVVDGDRILLGLETEFVGRSVDRPAADAAARHPDTKSVGGVIAAVRRVTRAVEFDGRGAPKLSAEDDEGIVEHRALLEILKQGRDRLVDLAGEIGVVRLDVVVVVPRLAFAVPQLDVAHAALKQATRDERLAPVGFTPVKVSDMFRLRAQVEGVARLHLHAVGEFECLDAGIELWIAHAITPVFSIQLGQEIELSALLLRSR
jgi:hypothetical protein